MEETQQDQTVKDVLEVQQKISEVAEATQATPEIYLAALLAEVAYYNYVMAKEGIMEDFTCHFQTDGYDISVSSVAVKKEEEESS